MAQAHTTHDTTGATGATGATGTTYNPMQTVLQLIVRKGTVGVDGTMSVPAEQATSTIVLIDHDGKVLKSADLQAQVVAMLAPLVPPDAPPVEPVEHETKHENKRTHT